LLSNVASDSSSGEVASQTLTASEDAASLNLQVVAKLSSAADKEITRLTCSTRFGENQPLVIASSHDGCVRAFKLSATTRDFVKGVCYRIELAWMIAAIRSEIKPWIMKPLPHMVQTENKTALTDAAEGNDVVDQAWLLPPHSTEPLPPPAAKPSSNVGNKLRMAVRNIGAISSVFQSRDMWLLGGTSTSSATARWFNLNLDLVDFKRIVDADKGALIHAIYASDVLPMLDFERSKSNPSGIEVLSCTLALNYGTIVFAGYADGTFRIWRRISLLAPPSAVQESVSNMVYMACDDPIFRQAGLLHRFHCFRTLKLSDNGIADAVITREGRSVVVCDAMGRQFTVSICGISLNSNQCRDGFQFFTDVETPYLFTAEHTVKVRVVVPVTG
jgi:hypothetical protein